MARPRRPQTIPLQIRVRPADRRRWERIKKINGTAAWRLFERMIRGYEALAEVAELRRSREQ